MSDGLQQSNIADIANSLIRRKEHSYPTVLLLGSRAGGLFRSQTFLDTVQGFPGYTPPLSAQQDRFTAAYPFFERAGLGTDERDSLLVRLLNTITPTEADMCLVELVRQRLFDVIITTNIDRLLEQALENAGLRERFDFDVFMPERSQDFHLGGRQLYSRIIKAFGSFAARSYQIVKRNAYLDTHPPLKTLLEGTLNKDILVVGFDPIWDEEIVRAFLPNTDSSLWFIQEENLLDHPSVSRIFQGRRVKYVDGPEGSYETFFTTLYRLMQKSPDATGSVSVEEGQQALLLSAPDAEPRLVSLEHFVNRTTELQIIDDAFATLADQDFVLRTPILVFQGIGGIGKTTLLQHVMERCNTKNLPYIHTDAQDIPEFSRAIVEQVCKYHGDVLALLEDDNNWLDRSVIATAELLRRGPAVMLVDSLDPQNTEQVKWLEELLGRVPLVNKFFVVLTSKSQVIFRRERMVTRRLKLVELKPLDRESCRTYLSRQNLQLEAEVRDLVYEWTYGYPLAMQVMKDSLVKGLDPRKPEDRLLMLQELVERVINQKVLAHVDQARLSEYRTILSLLSVPRCPSLEVIRTLIERFAPELQRQSNVTYWSLLHEISEVISWNWFGKGYSINTSVRNIFLQDLKIRQPELYHSLHAFLASFNQEHMVQASGLDRARYLCEYLYHLVCVGDDVALPEHIRQAIQQMQDQPPETFLQFSEEFMHDEELQETLDPYRGVALSLIHQILAQLYRQQARETSGTDRIRFLVEFFSHLMQDQEDTHLSQMLREQVAQLIQEETREIMADLFAEMIHNERFRNLLGPDYQRFVTQVSQNPPAEG